MGVALELGNLYLPGSSGPILPFLVFIIVLLLKPEGLFGEIHQECTMMKSPKLTSSLNLLASARRSVCIFNHNPACHFRLLPEHRHPGFDVGGYGWRFQYPGWLCRSGLLYSPLFIGIGAYLSTWLLLRLNLSPWLGMLVGGIFCALLALGIGYLYFRYGLRDVYFALGTMALVMIAQTVFLNLPDFGGAEGLVILIQEDNPFMMKFRRNFPIISSPWPWLQLSWR